MTRRAFLTQVTRHVGGNLAVQRDLRLRQLLRVPFYPDRKRMMIALLCPRYFDNSLTVRTQKKSRRIGLRSLRPWARRAPVSVVAAAAQYARIDRGIGCAGANARMQISQRCGRSEGIWQRIGRQKERARHGWTLY